MGSWDPLAMAVWRQLRMERAATLHATQASRLRISPHANSGHSAPHHLSAAAILQANHPLFKDLVRTARPVEQLNVHPLHARLVTRHSCQLVSAAMILLMFRPFKSAMIVLVNKQPIALPLRAQQGLYPTLLLMESAFHAMLHLKGMLVCARHCFRVPR
jgi:hypothetical protein